MAAIDVHDRLPADASLAASAPIKANPKMGRGTVKTGRGTRTIVGGRVNPGAGTVNASPAYGIRAACRVSFTISSSIVSPASTSWSSVMREEPLGREMLVTREQWNVNEGRETKTVALAHGLDRAPAQIIAEIAAGVARSARVDPGVAGRAKQFHGVRTEQSGVGVASNRSFSGAVAIGIGKQRGHRVAGAGLDPDMGRAASEAEHQQRLRAMSCQELRTRDRRWRR